MEFLVMFLATALTFFFLFFNVPYMTGKDMMDVSDSSIWQAIFYGLSTIGTVVYRFFEGVYYVLIHKLYQATVKREPKRGSIIVVFLNLLFYIGVVYLILNAFDSATSALLGIDDAEMYLGKDLDKMSKLDDLLIFVQVFRSLGDFDTPIGFFPRLGITLLTVLKFTCLSIAFFSFFYGLLENKVIEYHILSRTKDLDRNGIDDDEERNSLLVEVLGTLRDFVDDVAVMRHFKSIWVVIMTALLIAAYSLISVLRGETASILDVILEILDESDIFKVIGSFVISVIITFLFTKVCSAAVKVLPQSFQDKINNFSEKCKTYVQTSRTKRAEWASKYDCIYQYTTAEYTQTEHESINKMELK